MQINELKSIQSNLPTLTEKLQTWNRLLKEMDFKERENLSVCINNLELGIELEFLKSNLENSEYEHKYYQDLFSNLLKRLEAPIIAYKQKIEEIELDGWMDKVLEFKIESIRLAKEKAINLAIQYRNDWDRKVKDGILDKSEQKKYIYQCESLVTVYLFQSPYLGCGTDPTAEKKRKIFWDAFADWKPNDYVSLFCLELKKLFA